MEGRTERSLDFSSGVRSPILTIQRPTNGRNRRLRETHPLRIEIRERGGLEQDMKGRVCKDDGEKIHWSPASCNDNYKLWGKFSARWCQVFGDSEIGFSHNIIGLVYASSDN